MEKLTPPAQSNNFEIAQIQDIAPFLKDDETIKLYDSIDFHNVEPHAEMIIQGGRLTQYVYVEGISEAQNLHVAMVNIGRRKSIEEARLFPHPKRYIVLGSCSGVDSEFHSAQNPQDKQLVCGMRPWLLDVHGNMYESGVYERAGNYQIQRIGILN